MKSRTIIPVSLLVMLMVACSLTTKINGTPTNPGTEGEDTPTPTPAAVVAENITPNPVPVSINDGLASLNSYALAIRFSSFGPDPAKSNTTNIQRQRSNDTNSSFTSIKTNATSPGEQEPAISDSSIYEIGNDRCSGSDADGWEWTSSTPAEAEMQGLIVNMIGLTPLIDNPVFVANETVNGILTNHFSFQVSGLGASSGVAMNINQGDYWLAVDGQYIVKYILIVETSNAADAEVIHDEVSIELNQINQPVNIAFPQGCLNASQETPTQ